MNKTLRKVLLGLGIIAVIAVGVGIGIVGQSTQKQVTFTVTVTSPPITPDYGIAITPESITLVQGESGSFSITAISVGDYSDPIQLTLVGLPVGSFSFSANPVMPGGTSVLTINSTNLVAGQTYSCTLTAVGGADQSPF